MMAATGKLARQLFDEVQRLPQVEAFDPGAFSAQLRTEILAEPVTGLDDLEVRDGVLRGVLVAIDGFTSKILRIRLDHLLADDRSVAAPFRTYLASTVASYADDLERLRERVASSAARIDPHGAAATADAIVTTAAAALAVRADLRADLFALVRELAAAYVPTALAAARDVWTPDPLRLRWSAARRDLEQLVANPAGLAAADFATRLHAQPEFLDQADLPLGQTREELIELD